MKVFVAKDGTKWHVSVAAEEGDKYKTVKSNHRYKESQVKKKLKNY